MIKQIQDRKVEELEAKLVQCKQVIKELIGGLDCKDPEIRALIKDTAIEYMHEGTGVVLDVLNFDEYDSWQP